MDRMHPGKFAEQNVRPLVTNNEDDSNDMPRSRTACSTMQEAGFRHRHGSWGMRAVMDCIHGSPFPGKQGLQSFSDDMQRIHEKTPAPRTNQAGAAKPSQAKPSRTPGAISTFFGSCGERFSAIKAPPQSRITAFVLYGMPIYASSTNIPPGESCRKKKGQNGNGCSVKGSVLERFPKGDGEKQEKQDKTDDANKKTIQPLPMSGRGGLFLAVKNKESLSGHVAGAEREQKGYQIYAVWYGCSCLLQPLAIDLSFSQVCLNKYILYIINIQLAV